ncbi:MAG: hypothetical protein H6Q59_702 [Firmicutes bacterium]|nr:hypothetical protein [Bacillota bacterium]
MTLNFTGEQIDLMCDNFGVKEIACGNIGIDYENWRLWKLWNYRV